MLTYPLAAKGAAACVSVSMRSGRFPRAIPAPGGEADDHAQGHFPRHHVH